MIKQFTVSGITFQENHWVRETEAILLSPIQYAALEQLFYLLMKDMLVHQDDWK
jgi:hypothetical protein